MGKDPWMLALDSNAMTDFILGMGACSVAPSQHEQIALVRIFLWMPPEACFRLTPTVEKEYQAIKDRDKLAEHLRALSHLSGVGPQTTPSLVEERARELRVFHRAPNAENDCRIVAECECYGLPALLTRDKLLLRNLRTETRAWLVKPTEFWDYMRVPKGIPPNKLPASGNPLASCSWWGW